ncbi:MAG TPA: hypothetical protein VNG51_21130 [Ktedonobacteraceae bacterium]|nr:hypothetical protein [Ktedonobacteraceae bacterium]
MEDKRTPARGHPPHPHRSRPYDVRREPASWHRRDGGRVDVVGGPSRASVVSLFSRIAGIACKKFGMTHVS